MGPLGVTSLGLCRGMAADLMLLLFGKIDVVRKAKIQVYHLGDYLELSTM